MYDIKKIIPTMFLSATVLLLAGCGTKPANPSAGPSATPSANSPAAPASGAGAQNQPATQDQAEANTVTIKGFSFNPATLKIKKGTTVTWINEDSVTHTINSATFSSGNLGKGDKFQFTFNEAGTFSYSCGIHPSMKGQIVVE